MQSNKHSKNLQISDGNIESYSYSMKLLKTAELRIKKETSVWGMDVKKWMVTDVSCVHL